MTTSSKTLLLAAGLVASLSGVSLAQPPSGPIAIDFDSTDTAVWNLSGHYTLQQQMLVAGGYSSPLTFGVDVVQSPAGALTGKGLAVVNIGGDNGSFFAASYTVQGKVSGGGGHPARPNLTLRLRGQDRVEG